MTSIETFSFDDSDDSNIVYRNTIKSVPSSSPVSVEGQLNAADKANSSVPSTLPKSRAGQKNSAEKANLRVPVPAYLDQLAELQVRRKFYISTVNKQTNAAKALVRRFLGWKSDDEDEDREKVNARAARIVSAVLNGKDLRPEDGEQCFGILVDLAVIASSVSQLAKSRHEIELSMKRTVRKLPVYASAMTVSGFGELGLAVLLAETGDLAKYPKKGHVWKRLGLAPFDGKAFSTWRKDGGLSSDEWIDAGYSPRRRAEIYAVISEPLFKHQTMTQGPYRLIYDHRRAHTSVTNPEWTKKHSHMDGLRIMTKHLVRDLWQAWKSEAVRHDDQATF